MMSVYFYLIGFGVVLPGIGLVLAIRAADKAEAAMREDHD